MKHHALWFVGVALIAASTIVGIWWRGQQKLPIDTNNFVWADSSSDLVAESHVILADPPDNSKTVQLQLTGMDTKVWKVYWPTLDGDWNKPDIHTASDLRVVGPDGTTYKLVPVTTEPERGKP